MSRPVCCCICRFLGARVRENAAAHCVPLLAQLPQQCCKQALTDPLPSPPSAVQCRRNWFILSRWRGLAGYRLSHDCQPGGQTPAFQYGLCVLGAQQAQQAKRVVAGRLAWAQCIQIMHPAVEASSSLLVTCASAVCASASPAAHPHASHSRSTHWHAPFHIHIPPQVVDVEMPWQLLTVHDSGAIQARPGGPRSTCQMPAPLACSPTRRLPVHTLTVPDRASMAVPPQVWGVVDKVLVPLVRIGDRVAPALRLIVCEPLGVLITAHNGEPNSVTLRTCLLCLYARAV